MFYVYVIRSLSHPKRYYIGFTENIDQRIKEHNEGKSLHTAKYGPWQRYLKSGSGRAFLQRHIL
jgi:putative endonuclease